MVVHNVSSSAQFFSMLNTRYYDFTIVNYTAKWCGPCKQMYPYYEAQSRIYTDIQFLRVDVDELEEVSSWANVSAMPTFTIYASNRHLQHAQATQLSKLCGASVERLIDLIRQYSVRK